MTPEQKIHFEGVNQLWLLQMATMQYHLDMAVQTVKTMMPNNDLLYKLEQEYGVERINPPPKPEEDEKLKVKTKRKRSS